MNKSFEEIVKDDDRLALNAFYSSQRDSFVKWANSRYECDSATILDVYQDSIIFLYNKIKNGEGKPIKSTAEAYLFGIAKHLMYKSNVNSRKVDYVEDAFTFQEEIAPAILTKINNDERSEMIKSALLKLGTKCRQIIEYFYYDKFDMDSIAIRLGYDNPKVAKARKNQCMKKLKEIMKA